LADGGRRRAPLACHVLARPADQLAHRGFGRLQDIGDLCIRVIEGSPQHIRGAFVERELFHQQQGRELQGFPAGRPSQ
jgi:hypothetical protein